MCPVLGEGERTPPAHPTGRRPRCLRALRQQAAEPWSHLHAQEQLAVTANGTAAARPTLSLTVVARGLPKTESGAGRRARARPVVGKGAAITGTLSAIASQPPLAARDG